jgi:hypothetical protein
VTTIRSPTIAGVEAFAPAPCRDQITLPVFASSAAVRPPNVLT